jgi:hypothetical protein
MRRAAALLMVGFAAGAGARDAGGFLSLIHTPNDGTPAVVVVGGSFEAVVTEEMPLRIANDSSTHALNLEWHTLPDGRCRARCTVPAAAAPGPYTLQAGDGGQADGNARSVYVVEAFPDTYLAAHIAAPRIGSERHKRPAHEIFAEVIQAVNTSDAAVALISGDLTEHGEQAELRSFLDGLGACTVPTFVSPGPRDRAFAAEAFGPPARVFRYGEDGYLAFGGRDTRVTGELGSEDADIQRMRRLIKPCRWSIGLCDSCGPGLGMRTQVTLFLDDPLDHVFCSLDDAGGEPVSLPWGTTAVTETAPGLDGFMGLFEVTPTGIVPRDRRPAARMK